VESIINQEHIHIVAFNHLNIKTPYNGDITNLVHVSFSWHCCVHVCCFSSCIWCGV